MEAAQRNAQGERPRRGLNLERGTRHADLDRAGRCIDAAIELEREFLVKLAHEIVNVHGGACALGHPIGASGARIMVTLIHALQARGLRKGLATLCIGGGEATALALELI